MPQIFYSLALLACPLGMGVMMYFMMRGNKQEPSKGSTDGATSEELTRLRAEVDQLRAHQRAVSAGPGAH